MKTKCLVLLGALILSSGLVACGGGGGDAGGESSSGNGSEPVRETGDGVPLQARADGQAFVSWLQTVLADTDSQAEPVKVDGARAVPVDELAQPRTL